MRPYPPVVAALWLLTGCGGQDYDSPKALAEALSASDVDCVELREASVGDGSEASAECRTADGRDIGLQVHDAAEQASTFVAGADLILQGTNRRALVHDGRWIVYVDDERTAREVQDAVGGEITQVAPEGG
ncbi:MAG TPA: hypothetical protein VM433_06140 [Mycobacteriales bacterium]|nr:hypothetical protein [Mycobacteriales bacterium]